MSSRGRMLVLVAAVALVLGSMGSAAGDTARAVTKAQVKKVAAKVVKKAAPTLSVASARTADSAKTAASATNADKLDGVDSTGFVSTPAGMQVLIAGQVNTTATIQQKLGDWSATRVTTGQYDVTWAGGSLNQADAMCQVTGIGVYAQRSSNGTRARIYTYTSGGSAADGLFDIVCYRVG